MMLLRLQNGSYIRGETCQSSFLETGFVGHRT